MDNNENKKKYDKKTIITNVSIILGTILCIVIYFVMVKTGIMTKSIENFLDLICESELSRDFEEYSDLIGDNAKNDLYKSKWGMSEEIFPETLDDKKVDDFLFYYYNPWDAQYLSYLVLDYSDKELNDDYNAELDRLNKIGIDEYEGIYGVTGFSKYDLVAMDSDTYQGFVYALNDKENKKIIYVELIFCNYFFDIAYDDYIDSSYLPDGFDAHLDNPYQKKFLG
ncbi:MAG: hypothetical protein MJ232_07700 [archaeon]|nr:hypothetical protein [archaeon]